MDQTQDHVGRDATLARREEESRCMSTVPLRHGSGGLIYIVCGFAQTPRRKGAFSGDLCEGAERLCDPGDAYVPSDSLKYRRKTGDTE